MDITMEFSNSSLGPTSFVMLPPMVEKVKRASERGSATVDEKYRGFLAETIVAGHLTMKTGIKELFAGQQRQLQRVIDNELSQDDLVADIWYRRLGIDVKTSRHPKPGISSTKEPISDIIYIATQCRFDSFATSLTICGWAFGDELVESSYNKHVYQCRDYKWHSYDMLIRLLNDAKGKDI